MGVGVTVTQINGESGLPRRTKGKCVAAMPTHCVARKRKMRRTQAKNARTISLLCERVSVKYFITSKKDIKYSIGKTQNNIIYK